MSETLTFKIPKVPFLTIFGTAAATVENGQLKLTSVKFAFSTRAAYI